MPAVFRFALNDLPPEAESLRAEVRDFLRKEFSGAAPVQRAKSWGGEESPRQSRALLLVSR